MWKSRFMLLRPEQWVKNVFCLAGVVFGDRIGEPGSILSAVLTAATFCLVSSGTYAFNDIFDRDQDLLHPAKSSRPVASGAIPVGDAWRIGTALLAGGIVSALTLGKPVAVCVLLYLLNNLLYNLFLRKAVILDVVSIALGFCLRLLAGIWVLGDTPTTWIILCTFFLAIFLGSSKRYGERSTFPAGGNPQRQVLDRYSLPFLEQAINGSATMTILSYALFCAIAHKNPSLVITVPIVYYVVMSYKRLVFDLDAGEEAETILLKDSRILIGIGAWLVAYMAIQRSGIGLFR
jgi:4-hydroxybenzoate polyprenyltransferase